MENTTPFLFDNIDEKFFLAIQGKAIGPLTAQEVFEKIHKGEVGLLHYLWRQGWADWKRVCDEKEFALLVPKKPTTASVNTIRQKIAKDEPAIIPSSRSEARNFYLYHSRSQYGPFSKNEMVHVIKTHKLDRSAYIWTPGWSNWKRIGDVKDFAEYFENEKSGKVEKSRGSEPLVNVWEGKGSKKEKSKKITGSTEKTMGVAVASHAGVDASERRGAPRRPLVARLFLHNDQEVIIAVCRDISVGGMQVLTDRIPGEVGSKVKLNVSPGDPTKVKSFVAEGEIVRVLEDGRGFSFRFTKMNEDAKKALLKYIRT